MNSAEANEVMSNEGKKLKTFQSSFLYLVYSHRQIKIIMKKIPGTFGIVIQSSERNVFN